jgi:Flp pilus assembly protein TadG
MLILVLLVATFEFAWLFFRAKSQATKATFEMNRAVSELQTTKINFHEMAAENEILSKYKAIIDVDAECLRLREETKTAVEAAVSNWSKIGSPAVPLVQC